jgi:sec-independent protein translocase protein TatB
MFDLSWSHILIFLVVALVVVGPKDMPKLLRMIGGWVGKARGMANEFRKSFDDMARQSELDELRAEISAMRYEKPLSELERDMHKPVMREQPRIDETAPQSVAPVASVPMTDTPEATLASSEPSEPIPGGAEPPPP